MKQKNICKYFDVCPIKRFYEEGKIGIDWVKNYCFRGGKSCRRYEMEERGIYHPDNMLPDGTIDSGLT